MNTQANMPNALTLFNRRPIKDTTTLDKLATDFVDSDTSENIRIVFDDYVEFYKLDEDVDAISLLVGIITEYQRIAFKAGFETAKELLK